MKIIYNTSMDKTNDILYCLCNKYHNHNDSRINIAKMYLISHVTSSEIERLKKERDNKNTIKLYEKIGKLIKEKFNTKGLGNIKSINENTIKRILKKHRDLLNIISDNGYSELNSARSFCSKYLHFHYEDLYFIFDRNAVKKINELSKKYYKEIKEQRKELKLTNLKKNDYDEKYKEFFLKSYSIMEKMNEVEKRKFNIRQFDNSILGRHEWKNNK